MDIRNLKYVQVVVDFRLFKKLRIHDFFDPRGPKVFGWNFHHLSTVVYSVISVLVFGYAAIGLFVELEDKLTEVDIVLTISAHIGHVVSLLQVCTLIRHSDKVWNLFSVFRVNLMASDRCCKHFETLHKTRVRSTRIISMYAVVTLTLAQFIASEGANRRLTNVYNLRFPEVDLSIDLYNEYYMTFYTFEFLNGVISCY